MEALDHQGGKPKRRFNSKAGSRLEVKKVKATLYLTIETSQRLDIHATMMGKDRSELVEELVTKHLRRYVVSDRGGDHDESEPKNAD